jgi:hypothetical protein
VATDQTNPTFTDLVKTRWSHSLGAKFNVQLQQLQCLRRLVAGTLAGLLGRTGGLTLEGDAGVFGAVGLRNVHVRLCVGKRRKGGAENEDETRDRLRNERERAWEREHPGGLGALRSSEPQTLTTALFSNTGNSFLNGLQIGLCARVKAALCTNPSMVLVVLNDTLIPFRVYSL